MNFHYLDTHSYAFIGQKKIQIAMTWWFYLEWREIRKRVLSFLVLDEQEVSKKKEPNYGIPLVMEVQPLTIKDTESKKTQINR